MFIKIFEQKTGETYEELEKRIGKFLGGSEARKVEFVSQVVTPIRGALIISIVYEGKYT